MNSKVVLLRCDNYDKELIYNKIKKGIEQFGGAEKIAGRDESILLKLNLLKPSSEKKATITHPVVTQAVARILHEAGFMDITAGDSSGIGNAVTAMKEQKLTEPFEKYNVKMSDFSSGVITDNPNGIHAKKFILAEEVKNADAVISISKMKTHALEYITGAVKNQYGCVAGLNKAMGHTVYPSQESFAMMLVDLNLYIKPRFYIMDGILAMEGNGPSSGNPVDMNVILMSDDPVALDSVFCRMISLPPEIVPTNYFGKQMGLGEYENDRIDVWTEDGIISPEEAGRLYGKPDFDVMRTRHTSKGIMGFITKLNIFKRRPKINKELCRKCGVCVEVCPVEGKAINFTNGRDKPPVYDYKKCIKCFCCQEMCPHKAISVKGKN